MNAKLILALALVLLALGCTDYHLAIVDVTAPPATCANSSSIEEIIPTHFIQNWTAQNITAGATWTNTDDNIRGIIIDYHFGGKEWKYITIDGATCKQIPCGFEGAYCLECEELNKSW